MHSAFQQMQSMQSNLTGLFIFFSIYLCFCIVICLFVCFIFLHLFFICFLFLSLFIYLLSASPSVYLSLCPSSYDRSIYFSTHLSISLYRFSVFFLYLFNIYTSIFCLSIYLSKPILPHIYLFFFISLHPFICRFLSLFLYHSIRYLPFSVSPSNYTYLSVPVPNTPQNLVFPQRPHAHAHPSQSHPHAATGPVTVCVMTAAFQLS